MSKEVQRIKTLLNLESFDGYKGLIEPIEQVVSERNLLRNKQNNLETLIKNNDLWKGDIYATVVNLIEIATAPDTTPPQLSEERYVLHGDIQPCTVLYSDHTTTLLRLPEGDVMLETDTIEWSDSVTYRCQELLRDGTSSPWMSAVKVMAQLVRDERILLNDNGGEVRYPCALPCPPAPAPKPTCNNRYKHKSTLCEQDLRAAGWTTEGLVQNGYGHYLPAQDEEQPCEECKHVFDAQSMTCPMCMAIRSSEWTDTNSPTPLR